MLNKYISENKQRFLDELFDLLRIPSVSADANFKSDVKKTADFVRDAFQKIGLDKAEVFPTAGHPVVYAEKIIDQT